MSARGIDQLLDVMRKLRNPRTGCAWDLEQTLESIAPYTLEEAFELVEAIESRNVSSIKDELGDVLFQVVFLAQVADDKGMFSFDSVAAGAAEKMIERHPHVFGDRDVTSAEAVITNWEADKAAKRKARADAEGRAPSILDDITSSLPGPTRAVKLQNRASRVGFDWTDTRDVVAKIREEISELEVEILADADKDFLEDEVGDVLFAVVNLARKLGVDPESALRRTNRKFERRFRGIEATLSKDGRDIASSSLPEMEKIWNDLKKEEKTLIRSRA